MKANARILGKKIRSENGVAKTVEIINHKLKVSH